MFDISYVLIGTGAIMTIFGILVLLMIINMR